MPTIPFLQETLNLKQAVVYLTVMYTLMFIPVCDLHCQFDSNIYHLHMQEYQVMCYVQGNMNDIVFHWTALMILTYKLCQL